MSNPNKAYSPSNESENLRRKRSYSPADRRRSPPPRRDIRENRETRERDSDKPRGYTPRRGEGEFRDRRD